MIFTVSAVPVLLHIFPELKEFVPTKSAIKSIHADKTGIPEGMLNIFLAYSVVLPIINPYSVNGGNKFGSSLASNRLSLSQ